MKWNFFPNEIFDKVNVSVNFDHSKNWQNFKILDEVKMFAKTEILVTIHKFMLFFVIFEKTIF